MRKLKYYYLLILLLYIGSNPLIFAQQKQTVVITEFSRILGNIEPSVNTEIQNKLQSYLESNGYNVILSPNNDREKSIQYARSNNADYLISGYIKKDKYLEIYGQIYDPNQGIVIDAYNAKGSIEGLESVGIQVEEVQKSDAEVIKDFSEKIGLRVRLNKNKVVRTQNISEFVLNSKEMKTMNLPLQTVSIQSESEDVFKLLQELNVVTATRTATRLSDTPSSMTVITRQDIIRYGYRTLPEALARVPEVYVHFNGHNQSADFRGFFTNNAERRVLYLLNGMKLNDRFHFGDFYPDVFYDLTNVERIEVIRGPGAALYGNNSVLGVVNIITRDFKDKDQDPFTLMSEFADVKRNSLTNRMQVIYNKRYNENYAFMADVSYYRGNIEYDTHTGWENRLGRDGIARFRHGHDVYFKADKVLSDGQFRTGYNIPNFHTRFQVYDFIIGMYNYSRVVSWIWPKDNNTFDHPDNDRAWGTSSIFIQYKPRENFLSKLDFEMTISRDYNTNREIADFDALKSRNRIRNVAFGANQTAWIQPFPGYFINYVHLIRTLKPYLNSNEELERQILLNGGGTQFNYHGVDVTNSFDFQISPYKSQFFTFMLGGNGLVADYNNYQRFTFRNNEPIGFARFGGISDSGYQLGGWLQGLFNFTEKISMTTGVRYDYQKIWNVERQLGGQTLYLCDSRNRIVPDDPNECIAIQEKDRIAQDITPRLMVNYRFNRDHNIRALYGEAFRFVPPQEVIRLARDPLTNQIREAKSEKTRNYEIIYSGSYDQHFLFTANAFRIIGSEIYSWNPAVQGFFAAEGWQNTGGSLELKYISKYFDSWLAATRYELRRAADYPFTVWPGSADALNAIFGRPNNPYPGGYPIQGNYRPLDSPEFLFRLGIGFDFYQSHNLAAEVYHNGKIESIHPARNRIELVNGRPEFISRGTSNIVYELYHTHIIPHSTYVNLTYSYDFGNKFRFMFKVENVANAPVYGVLPVDAENSYAGNPYAPDPYARGYHRAYQLPTFGRMFHFQLTYNL